MDESSIEVVDHAHLDLEQSPRYEHLRPDHLEDARVVREQHAGPLALGRRSLNHAGHVLGRPAAAALGQVLPSQAHAEIIRHVVGGLAMQMSLRQHDHVRALILGLVDDGLERFAAPVAQRRSSTDVAAAVLSVLLLERLSESAIAFLCPRGSAAGALSLGTPTPFTQPPIRSRLAKADASGIPN